METDYEKVMSGLYKNLLELRYPGITQVTLKDMENTILASDNRLFLLSWLLRQCSSVPSDEFATNLDEAKIVEWYTSMGICLPAAADVLLGKVSMDDQIPVLENLLLFVENVLMVDVANPETEISVMDILQKYIGASINIIPPECDSTSELKFTDAYENINSTKETSVSLQKDKSSNEKHITGSDKIIPSKCTLTPKLNDDEAMQNKNSTKEIPDTLQKAESSNQIFSMNENKGSPSKQEQDEEKAVENFLESFESISTWPQVKNEQSALWNSMNTHVENAYSNMNMLKETLQSKEEISNFVTEQIEKPEMPLDEIIEDIVTSLEKVTNLDEEK